MEKDEKKRETLKLDDFVAFHERSGQKSILTNKALILRLA